MSHPDEILSHPDEILSHPDEILSHPDEIIPNHFTKLVVALLRFHNIGSSLTVCRPFDVGFTRKSSVGKK